MRIAKKFSPGPPTHPTTWKVLVLDNQTDLGFEESCGGLPLRRPLTHLLLLFLEHFSSSPEESLGERSKCRSVREKCKTLKTKIEATTVAFINQDRLLQHILEWNKSHIWHEGDMDTCLVTLMAILLRLLTWQVWRSVKLNRKPFNQNSMHRKWKSGKFSVCHNACCRSANKNHCFISFADLYISSIDPCEYFDICIWNLRMMHHKTSSFPFYWSRTRKS